jgi:cyanophycin synthetase
VMGGVGDRSDEMLRSMGELGARGADRVAIAHKEQYLRGRASADLEQLMRQGAAAVGVHDVPAFPTELAALRSLVEQASPADVIGVMCHAQREDLDLWLRESGATIDGPDELRHKVLAAKG